MARRTLEQCINIGILTTGSLATLLNVVPPTVRSWCRTWAETNGRSGLKHETISSLRGNSKGEIRILASDAVEFCKKYNLYISKDLQRAYKNSPDLFIVIN